MNQESPNLKATVRLHNYRFPTGKAPVSGGYAVVILEVIEIQRGEIPLFAYGREYAGGKTITVCGYMPRLESGMKYTLEAELVNDKKYGFQYKCKAIQSAYDLAKPEDQRTFFSYFLTPKQIDSLFLTYKNPIEKLANKDIEALVKIKGVGPVTATRLCEKYADNVTNSRAYVELNGLGLTRNAINNIVRQVGSADVAISMIKENPYMLIRFVRGYGWEKADAVAQKRGFGKASKERCIAYAKFRLDKCAEDGNSCVSVGELLDDVSLVCSPVARENLSSYLKEEMAGQKNFDEIFEKIKNKEKVEKPLFFYSADTKKIGLFDYKLLEHEIAGELQRLAKAPSPFHYDKEECEKIIQQTEEEQGYKYTMEQRKAIWMILDNNVSVLTGAAGCGKSSTVKPIIAIMNHYGKEVVQTALSGRAASLLTEYTGLEGKTIHRLLGLIPDDNNVGPIIKRNKSLTADLIVLDETSMVGEELFLSLVQAIKDGAKLVMLGDIKQLPPISVGNLLSDCMASGYIPTTTLTTIHRQALKSGIISQSFQVCGGHSLVKNDFSGEEIRGELKDFKINCSSEPSVVHVKVIEEFKKLMNKGVNPNDIQIVVPMRAKGINSCRTFNAEIQRLVNGDEAKKHVDIIITDSGVRYPVSYKHGDKIMVIKNNYHAKNVYGKEVAIFNGNMGRIVDIDEDAMIVKLDEQGEIVLPKDEWDLIIHSWTCTCHKLQGSQSPYVIIGLDNAAYSLLSREWLYTAITRAKKYCVLVGQPKAINTACRTSNIKLKQTWLRGELQVLYKEALHL